MLASFSSPPHAKVRAAMPVEVSARSRCVRRYIPSLPSRRRVATSWSQRSVSVDEEETSFHPRAYAAPAFFTQPSPASCLCAARPPGLSPSSPQVRRFGAERTARSFAGRASVPHPRLHLLETRCPLLL